MSPRPLVLVGLVAAGVASTAATAHGAVITTDRPCYVEQQPLAISGTQFAPNSRYSAGDGGQVFVFGEADAAGNWLSTAARAPIVPERTTRPKTFTLTAKQDGVDVATASFDVVNLLVTLASTRGKPTSRTTWRFSGFAPGESIYVHVRRGGKTLANVRMGRGDSRCGRLSTKQRRLPGVSSKRLRTGRYDLYMDNRRTFSPTKRPQYRSSISIFRTFR